VHSALLEFIPRRPGLLALDVGAGLGRDAAWLCASLGYEVVAVEPAAGTRAEGKRRNSKTAIRWLDDRLPDLHTVHGLGLGFDLVLASAVWMHVPPAARVRAFRKLVTSLKLGGVLLLTLREGPPASDREMSPAGAGEIEGLARTHGLAVLRSVITRDQFGRSGIEWTAMCLQGPDDGTGSLPLLRGVILNDDKSSTYKLALLRAVARAADTAPALAVARVDEDVVDLPLGLVALNWIRMCLPLATARLPPAPGNNGPDGLGFAKEGFRTLLALSVVGQDLRVGAHFT
jgi:SAM-dependent methyltransferase